MANEKEEGKEEEVKKEGGGAPPKPKGGKRSLIKFAIIGVVALMLMGGGFYGFKVFSKKDTGHGAVGEKKSEEGTKEPGQMVPLDPFVINLADPEVRYLKISINLEADSEQVKEEANNRMPQIRDTILMLMTSKTSEDVKDVGGKLKLQDEIVSRVNHYFSKGKIKAVYFTEFVMQ